MRSNIWGETTDTSSFWVIFFYTHHFRKSFIHARFPPVSDWTPPKRNGLTKQCLVWETFLWDFLFLCIVNIEWDYRVFQKNNAAQYAPLVAVICRFWHCELCNSKYWMIIFLYYLLFLIPSSLDLFKMYLCYLWNNPHKKQCPLHATSPCCQTGIAPDPNSSSCRWRVHSLIWFGPLTSLSGVSHCTETAGPAVKITSHSWSGTLWLGIAKSELTFSACCHRNPPPGKVESTNNAAQMLVGALI